MTTPIHDRSTPLRATSSGTPRWRTLLILAALCAVSLAGCLGDAATDDRGAEAGDAATGDMADPSILVTGDDEKVRDLRTELTADDVLQAPQWTPGDLFGQHVFFGSDDTEGIHFDAVVHATGAGAFHLATDHPEAALQNALNGLPMLGRVDASDLSSEDGLGLWKIYEFPLKDGAAWQGQIPNIAFDSVDGDHVDITFTATYAEAIDTLSGRFPGFVIEGHTSNGTLIIETDYLPEIRWYNRLLVHDIDPWQDPVEFEVRSMGHERGWTGELFGIEATTLFATREGVGFTDPPWDGGEPFAEPDPYQSFTVGAGYDELYVTGWAFAVIGAKQATLLAPDGATHEWRAQSTELDDAWHIWSKTIPPVEGEWHWSTAGAGGLVRAYCRVAGLDTETIVVS